MNSFRVQIVFHLFPIHTIYLDGLAEICSGNLFLLHVKLDHNPVFHSHTGFVKADDIKASVPSVNFHNTFIVSSDIPCRRIGFQGVLRKNRQDHHRIFFLAMQFIFMKADESEKQQEYQKGTYDWL